MEKKKHFTSKLWAYFLLLMATAFIVTATSGEQVSAAPKISKKSITLIRDHGYNVRITGTTKKITWKANRPGIASVKKTGKKKARIIANKPGVTNIKATIGKKTYNCRVKVVDARMFKESYKTVLNIFPDYITNDYMPKTVKLRVIGQQPDSWKSSNTAIATVNKNGKVTPKQVGTCTITAVVGNSKLNCKFTVLSPNYDGSKWCIDTGVNGLHVIGGQDHLVYDGKFVSELDIETAKQALLCDPMIRKFYEEYLSPEMNDVQRVLAILQFYEDMGCTYGYNTYVKGTDCDVCYGNEAYHQSAHAVLYGRKAWCNGYAKCTEYLCMVADVPCFYVTQNAPIHAYNVIQIQGEWYNFDTTGGGTGSTAWYAISLNDNYMTYFLNWSLTVDDYKDTWNEYRLNVAKGYLRYSDTLPVISNEHVTYRIAANGENVNGQVTKEGDILRTVFLDAVNSYYDVLSEYIWYSAETGNILPDPNAPGDEPEVPEEPSETEAESTSLPAIEPEEEVVVDVE